MVVDYIKTEFARRCQKNPNYSLRAFARTLNMDSSTLSAILRGKRSLSFKMAKRLMDTLEVESLMRLKLAGSFLSVENPAQNFFQVDEDTINAISGWEHFALLSLFQTNDTKPSAKWAAMRLGISIGQTIAALDRLERLNLISRKGNPWKVTHQKLTTSHDLPSSALRKVHKEYIAKAVDSIESIDVSSRDITGSTMAINKNKLKEAKELIRDFRRNMATLLETGKKSEVYRLNIQFFPLTKESKK